ncbi:AAA family ATPase, partial [Mediterraneibacter gnavus]
MSKTTESIYNLPPILSGERLISSLTVLPEYEPSIIHKSETERLMALSDIYRIYIPSKMSQEIYSKLYLSLMRSLQKKRTDPFVMQQQQNNFRMIQKKFYNGGIIGGSDSFSIIGNSGIGKSASIFRAIDLITDSAVIEFENPYAKVIPSLVVQCPFDSSVKGLLLEILRKADELLDSKYYENAIKIKATTDTLIGCVSQIALNNIGLLIVDEIQNICNSKNGKTLVGSITQLVNNSGISICFVGTPECKNFFDKVMHLARRTMGLEYTSLDFDVEFTMFCKIIFQYQYMEERIEITDKIIKWLYDHSSGNVSIVIALLHDAQEIGILSGHKSLSIDLFEIAYKQRMSVLHDYINISDKQKLKLCSKKDKQI